MSSRVSPAGTVGVAAVASVIVIVVVAVVVSEEESGDGGDFFFRSVFLAILRGLQFFFQAFYFGLKVRNSLVGFVGLVFLLIVAELLYLREIRSDGRFKACERRAQALWILFAHPLRLSR